MPVFFGGEELDQTPMPMPALQKGCYAGGGPGGWLYGSQFNWTADNSSSGLDGFGNGNFVPMQATENRSKMAMLQDTKRMLRIRRAERDLIHSDRCRWAPSNQPVLYISLVCVCRKLIHILLNGHVYLTYATLRKRCK